MCGIAGVWRLDVGPAEEIAATARRMSDRLVHRGPDDAGVWIDERAGIALAHRRLSIVDLSSCGHQPMVSADGRYVLDYNGEVYNHVELREALEGDGVVFRGRSDTEVLLEACSRWGLDSALRRVNGMFAFALWDRTEQKLHLARDRFGEKPLFVELTARAVAFGSELKAVAPVGQRVLDRTAVSDFLRYGYIPAPKSVYEGVRKLEPGTCLSISSVGQRFVVAEQRYFRLEDVVSHGIAAPFRGDATDAGDALEEVLQRAVAQRLMADVPVGAFLSGGIDSSLVVALMGRSTSAVRTFSVGLEEAAYDESTHAAAVAAHLGTEHTSLHVSSEDALALIPRLPEIWDEPFGDSSQIPTYLIAAATRRSVTVALSGDGGDELFGGYRRYRDASQVWGLLRLIPTAAQRALRDLAVQRSDVEWDATLTRLLRGRSGPVTGHRIHRLGELLPVSSERELYWRLVSLWRLPERALRDAPAGRPPTWLSALPTASALTWMRYADGVSYLPDDILAKVDRATMAASLESRIPLLDPAVVSLAFSLPDRLLVRGGTGKAILRDVLFRHVPRELVERPKQGFGIPVGEWLRGTLRGWAEDLLSSVALNDGGLFETAPIRSRWAEHLTGRRDWTFDLWPVLMFQSWFAHYSAAAP